VSQQTLKCLEIVPYCTLNPFFLYSEWEDMIEEIKLIMVQRASMREEEKT
jgi:hypothetical protein